MTYYSRLIDRYTAGEMDQDEAMRFESELKSNLQLASEFRLDQDIEKVLEDDDLLDFSIKMKKIHEKQTKSQRKIPSIIRLYRRMSLAAASLVVLLVTIGMLYMFLPEKYTNEKLFSIYYNPNDIIGNSRSGSNQIFDAVLKFQQKDYQTALLLFDNILLRDSSNISIRFYKGIANIETGYFTDAIHEFKFIIHHDDNLFVERATWFLGLTYLRTNEAIEARRIFRSIADDKNNYFSKEANEILKKIQDNS